MQNASKGGSAAVVLQLLPQFKFCAALPWFKPAQPWFNPLWWSGTNIHTVYTVCRQFVIFELE